MFLRRPQADAIALGPAAGTTRCSPRTCWSRCCGGSATRSTAPRSPALTDGVFEAELVFDGGTRIPVLPSDALAVAVREGLPITIAEEILDEVGQPVAELFPQGGAAPPEEQVQEMRKFLSDVSPDDFADPPR